MKSLNMFTKLGLLAISAIIFQINIYAVNLNIIKNISDDNGTKTEIVSNIRDATGKIINDALKGSRITINKTPENDLYQKFDIIIKNSLKISTIAALLSVTVFAIKKIFFDKKNDNSKDSNEAMEKKTAFEDIENSIYEAEIEAQKLLSCDQQTLDKKFQLFSERKKWALWPSEMSFLKILEIPQEILLERLLDDINSTYKNDKNDTSSASYAIESFVKDVDAELTDYRKKYNIILIGNVERKEECLIKIKDNIKKLLYLKNSALNNFLKK